VQERRRKLGQGQLGCARMPLCSKWRKKKAGQRRARSYLSFTQLHFRQGIGKGSLEDVTGCPNGQTAKSLSQELSEGRAQGFYKRASEKVQFQADASIREQKMYRDALSIQSENRLKNEANSLSAKRARKISPKQPARSELSIRASSRVILGCKGAPLPDGGCLICRTEPKSEQEFA
jgi:hypothetical protein